MQQKLINNNSKAKASKTQPMSTTYKASANKNLSTTTNKTPTNQKIKGEQKRATRIVINKLPYNRAFHQSNATKTNQQQFKSNQPTCKQKQQNNK